MQADKSSQPLGINGLGRIGKLTLWNHLLTRGFDKIIVNTGREVGRSLEDLIQVIETDSTYGTLEQVPVRLFAQMRNQNR